MLKLIGISKKPCFLTGVQKDVVLVRFTDKSFSGSIAWSQLLEVIKRREANRPSEENEAKQETGQTGPSPIAKKEH